MHFIAIHFPLLCSKSLSVNTVDIANELSRMKNMRGQDTAGLSALSTGGYSALTPSF